MSKKIFKYELKDVGIQEIQLPEGAEILCIQTQNDIPFIWAVVYTNVTFTKRFFEIYATGQSFDGNTDRKYIGTYQIKNGAYVFHCFEWLGLS